MAVTFEDPVATSNGKTIAIDPAFLNAVGDDNQIIQFTGLAVTRRELRARVKEAIVKLATQWTPGPHPTKKRVLYLPPHLFNSILRAGCTSTRKYVFPADAGYKGLSSCVEWEVSILCQQITPATDDKPAVHSTSVHLHRPTTYPTDPPLSLSLKYNGIGSYCVITPKVRPHDIMTKDSWVAKSLGALFGYASPSEGPPAKRQRLSCIQVHSRDSVDLLCKGEHGYTSGLGGHLGNDHRVSDHTYTMAALNMMGRDSHADTITPKMDDLWTMIDDRRNAIFAVVNNEADELSAEAYEIPLNEATAVVEEPATPSGVGPLDGPYGIMETVVIDHSDIPPTITPNHGDRIVAGNNNPEHFPIGSPGDTITSDDSNFNSSRSPSRVGADPPTSVVSGTVSTTLCLTNLATPQYLRFYDKQLDV